MLDEKAKEHGFDSIFTAVTYADEPAVASFQLQGKSFRQWRSLVWAECYSIVAEYESGQRQAPTIEELIDMMPVFEIITINDAEVLEEPLIEEAAED